MTGINNNNKFIPKIPETKTEIILNQEQQTSQEQKSTTEKAVDSVKETVIPTAYASDEDDEKKEGAKKAIGYTLAGVDTANPPLGVAASAVTTAAGGIEEGLGKLFGNEDMEEGGKVIREGATQPIKDAGEAIKKRFE